MTEHRLTPLLEAYIAAWNSPDENAVEFFHEDGVYLDMALGQEIPVTELKAYIDDYYTIGTLCIKVVSGFAWSGDKVAFQATTEGTSHAGNEILVNSAEFIEYSGDKILRQQSYYDFMPQQNTGHSSKLYKNLNSGTANKYEKSSLRGLELASYKNKLIKILEEDRLYRDHALSLKKLAQHMKLSTHHLSQLINSQFGMTFFDFVHQFRIKEAMALLTNPETSALSVLEIADCLGFNSTSTFYNSFKKQVGMTPLQYKKKYLP